MATLAAERNDSVANVRVRVYRHRASGAYVLPRTFAGASAPENCDQVCSVRVDVRSRCKGTYTLFTRTQSSWQMQARAIDGMQQQPLTAEHLSSNTIYECILQTLRFMLRTKQSVKTHAFTHHYTLLTFRHHSQRFADVFLTCFVRASISHFERSCTASSYLNRFLRCLDVHKRTACGWIAITPGDDLRTESNLLFTSTPLTTSQQTNRAPSPTRIDRTLRNSSPTRARKHRQRASHDLLLPRIDFAPPIVAPRLSFRAIVAVIVWVFVAASMLLSH